MAGPAGLVAVFAVILQIALPAYLVQVEAYGDDPEALDCLHKGIAVGLAVGSGGIVLGVAAFGGTAVSPLLATVLSELSAMAITGTFNNVGECTGL